jgi:hypothetical protein
MEISPLKPITYSMLINDIDRGSSKKDKSSFDYIDREKLVNNFNLDLTFEPPDWAPYGNLPGFVEKSYYQSSPEIGYCYPPKGPIEKYFVCTYCKKRGPDFHTVNCKRPLESSLVLTQEGTEKYPGRKVGTNFVLIIKKPGQKKVISESLKSELFYDSVQLIYKYADQKKCTIRISRNGTINIISARATDDTLPSLIVKKINETGCLTKDFPVPKYVILPNLTNKYLILAQFDLYPEKLMYHIDLNQINEKLWLSPRFKKDYLGNEVFMLDTPDNNYVIEEYVFNPGNIMSRSNKPTPSILKFRMTTSEHPDIKISVVMYTRGAVQMRASHVKGASKVPLTNEYLVRAYNFIKEILKRIITDSQSSKFPIIVKEVLSARQLGEFSNLIEGNVPKACHDRENRKVRPFPFSFYGQCPEPGDFVAPRGIRRKDGKYEPCCYSFKKTGKDAKTRYYNMLVNGYPDAEAFSLYGELIPDPDTETAVYYPGTLTQESRRFKGLKDFSKETLLKCMENTGYIEAANVFSGRYSDSNYETFKKQVLEGYSKLTGTSQMINQSSSPLTYTNFKTFTKRSYIVTPIPSESINVLLYFDPQGKSFFINLNGDVSESGLPDIPLLQRNLLEGHLYPFKEPNFIFYPFDIIYYNGVDLTNKDYYTGNGDDRFSGLMNSVQIMNNSGGVLNIETPFDLDIINGSKYYINTMDISGLLFIPYTSKYLKQKTNKELLVWLSTTKTSNLQISLSVQKIGKNIWKVTSDGQDISPVLLPQTGGGIEISIKWAEDNQLKDNDIVLFKIMLNSKTHRINVGKPLYPLEKIDFKINDYSDVISILQSVQTPIGKETFTGDKKFSLGNTTLIASSRDVSIPLTIA